MDLRYLSAFLVAAKYLNFSRAAEELGIAQSAISRQIKLLEDSIDHELFIRSPRRVMLTDKGRELFKIGQEFVERAQSAMGKEDNSPLRIGILHGLLEDWFSAIVPAYMAKSDRSFQLHVQGQKELQSGLTQGLFDFIICDFSIQSDMLSSLKLFDEQMVLVSKQKITRKDIINERWIVYGPNDYLVKIHKTVPSNLIQVNSITTILALVKKGLGIAIVPDHAVQSTSGICSMPMQDLGRNEIFLTGVNYHNPPARILEFQQFILKEAQKLTVKN